MRHRYTNRLSYISSVRADDSSGLKTRALNSAGRRLWDSSSKDNNVIATGFLPPRAEYIWRRHAHWLKGLRTPALNGTYWKPLFIWNYVCVYVCVCLWRFRSALGLGSFHWAGFAAVIYYARWFHSFIAAEWIICSQKNRSLLVEFVNCILSLHFENLCWAFH